MKIRMLIKIIKKTKFLYLVFFYALATSVTTSSAQENKEPLPEPSLNVFLTLGDKHGFPLAEAKEVFDCSDQIFSVVKLHHYEAGDYALTIDWIDPSGDQRERTEYPFKVGDPHIDPNTRLWSWLRLKRGAGAGLFQWVDPTAGLGNLIGIWELRISIDGKHVNTTEFEVSC